jgi:hypothetical protein
LKTEQKIDEKIWQEIKNNEKGSYINNNTLSGEQKAEYDLIKNLSQQLIFENYKRYPAFSRITKTSFGYKIGRRCSKDKKFTCTWTVKIYINTKEVTISCNKNCEHSDQKKFIQNHNYNSIISI